MITNQKQLRLFLTFIKENYFEEFVKLYIKYVFEFDVPLLKYFTHLSDEELYAASAEGQKKFIEDFEKGIEFEEAAKSLKNWEEDKLPGISKEAVNPSDLILIYKAQKFSLLHFLKDYTDDPEKLLKIVLEIEEFYSTVQNDAIQLLFKMQKDAEQKVKEHEKQLEEQNKILMETQAVAEIGSYEWDLKTNKIVRTEQLSKLVENDESHITFNPHMPSVHPEDREMVEQAVSDAIKTRSSFDLYYRIVTNKGNIKIVQGRGFVIVDDNNDAVKILGTIQDQTKIKKIKRELEEKNQQLLTAQQIAKIGSCEWNISKEEFACSDQLSAILDISVEKLKDLKYLSEITHPHDRKAFENYIDAAIQSKGSFEFFQKVITQSGKTKTLHTIGTVIANDRNEAEKIIITFQDITDIESLKELNSLKDQFIGMASHELKTPLTTIVAYVQLLDMQLSKESNHIMKPLVDKISTQVLRLRALIDSLLDLNLIQTGNIHYNLEKLDFGKLVTEWKENFQLIYENAKIKLTGNITSEINGDKYRLEQVLNNLVSNAIKYSPDNEEVTVHLSEDKKFVKVEVTDKGIGIESDNMIQLFKKFSRIKGSSERFSGLGMGLFISKEVVNKHGGSISVTSEPGQGSTFCFTLPKAN